MGANFTPNTQTPNINPYSGQGSFRMWVQYVMPAVYDGTLSYYEQLCKVVAFLNNVIQDMDTAENNIQNIANVSNENTQRMLTAYTLLQKYVNDYFDNLDVQQEINHHLDEMAASGALSTLLAPFIPNLVTNWLNENVSPVGSAVVVDSSLTIQGAAADAKVTGDELQEDKVKLNQIFLGDISSEVQNTLELGNINVGSGGFSYTNSNSRIRTKRYSEFNLHVGDKITLSDFDGYTFGVGWTNNNGEYKWSNWQTREYTVGEDGQYVFLIRYASESVITNVNYVKTLLRVKTTSLMDVRDNVKKLWGLSNLMVDNLIDSNLLSRGYIHNNGTVVATDENAVKTTNFIPVTGGEKLYLFVGMRGAFWGVIAFYDAEKTFIPNRWYIGDDSSVPIINGYKTNFIMVPVDVNAAYIRVSYRTYNDGYAYLTRFGVGINNLIQTGYISPTNKGVKSIGHRGYDYLYPENTMISFLGACLLGFDCCETDIRFTSDNQPVCLHDQYINRTATNSNGSAITADVNINNITLQQALAYDFGMWKTGSGGRVFNGTKIPTLLSFLRCCKTFNVVPYIELKEYDGNKPNIIAEQVKLCGYTNNVTFIGSLDALTAIHSVCPNARLGYIPYSNQTVTQDEIDTLVSLKNDNEVFLNEDYGKITNGLVTLCYNNNIKIETWTAETRTVINSLNDYVTGIASGKTIPKNILQSETIY